MAEDIKFGGLGAVLLVLSLMLKGVKKLADAVKSHHGSQGLRNSMATESHHSLIHISDYCYPCNSYLTK